MKKLLAVLLCLNLTLVFLMGQTRVFADQVTVELDGNVLDFDVEPTIIDGRTLVPLRKIFEELGATVKWDEETRTVSARKNAKTITLVIDSDQLQIDRGDTDQEGNPLYETVTLDVPAQLVSGRTLVPARAISEGFGLSVDWDDTSNTVSITSQEEEDDSWKENVAFLDLNTLTLDGEGAEITPEQITITQGGDYTLTGSLTEGNLTIATEERVKLRLSNASITSSEGPCIFAKESDKVFLTLTEGTENHLVAKNSEDGAIYSKENLVIKGKGSLTVESTAGHGIKASDNLTIENGKIVITATSDGIHINDTFQMTGGTLSITATGDGIDCESIVKIEAGTLNIETNGIPLEATPVATPQETEESAQKEQRKGMQQKTSVEFASSSKGINAEWMMILSGGDITVNAASHAIHCQDEMEINGGTFLLCSNYDKGISAHGNLTIGGAETVIDITRSVEGIESKKVLTIHEGDLSVTSSDDALNATGGIQGITPGKGQGGGMQRPENSTTETGENRKNHRWQIPEDGTFPQGGGVPPMAEDRTFPQGNPMPPMEPGQIPDGEMPSNPPAGGRGQMGKASKACLIINGGTLELCGNDDCIDSNGGLIIAGGTVKAVNPTGAFVGNFGVLDADGGITIGEDATVCLAANSGNEQGLPSSQNALIVYCEEQHASRETISVFQGQELLLDFAPNGSFQAVYITSPHLSTEETYTITIGEECFETQLTDTLTVLGTPILSQGRGFGREQQQT